MNNDSLTPPLLPPATLGMLGGGQLGRFFVAAAHEMGYRVWVLDPDPHSPAGRIADRHLCADYNDAAALAVIAEGCAAVTTEFENVPAATLDHLARFVPVRPSASAVGVCQNRILEKSFLAEHGLPHGEFAVIRNEMDLADVPDTLFPAILKVARFGYDGKGQSTVADRGEALAAFRQCSGEACVLEKRLTLDCEVSVVLARDQAGTVRAFPVAENRHRAGILDVSLVPARVAPALAEEAVALAGQIAEKLAYVGVMAVEFFVVDGRLRVNEMAPRPHNSGHYTLDACVASQYEQQVRALCGLPLESGAVHSAAAMVNVLGDLWFAHDAASAQEPDWARLFAVPALKLHLYGKHQARRGRKMGHFTALAPLEDAEGALHAALSARAAIGIG
ncbi:5-(carboxyamino)imidazole ribonucleotide synthase [Rhodocyclus gracilis]|uniref:N5-carboxyaminoimidazole ribonucleotide synthase n=1 Tax=Rhodocyclus tenuis TaxID=1066 RepID=A0A6L5K088_RHOTE|nr:5-(carboxyamino)imidazole ribonucleotide synthase [Rhodocyclus gracilis]MQY52324.1 5-(carboxyamino)imidazole ribonucleotide synthase [Rhodocyclus gracilis]